MSGDPTNLVLEHLKAIQAEQAAARERDGEMIRRLSGIETAIARTARDQAQSFIDQVDDRHALDRMRERLDRIERRLDLTDT